MAFFMEVESNTGVPRILIVEDDPAMRQLLALHLRVVLPQAEYLEAGDGSTAIEMAYQRLPDLVVLDGDLPLVAGDEVARRLRAHPQLGRTPILGVSAGARFSPLVRNLRAECDYFFAKAGQMSAMREAARQLLHSGKQLVS